MIIFIIATIIILTVVMYTNRITAEQQRIKRKRFWLYAVEMAQQIKRSFPD
jgi:hypothetical protein